MRALILANGEPPSRELLEQLAAEADLFVCADGAANWLAATCAGRPCPQVVLGDFDSIEDSARNALGRCEFVHAADQEASDLDKAVTHALSKGATEVIVTGAAGGRLDQTLANVSILMRHHEATPPHVSVRIVEDGVELTVVTDEAVFRGAPGDCLSLICFAPVEHVWAEGVRWPLMGEPLTPGSRGLSNELAAERAHVRVEGGAIIASHRRLWRARV